MLDGNGEDYLTVTREYPRDQYLADARLINSINQTGYAYSNIYTSFPVC